MKENNLYDMIRSAFNTDEEGFKSFFDDEMKDRLAGKFAEKHVEISRDVITQDENEADEHQSNDT
tara:strand:+ start:2937 stop:3131 length:195 start_codon:yes stop_codon:yes gene_type:complete